MPNIPLSYPSKTSTKLGFQIGGKIALLIFILILIVAALLAPAAYRMYTYRNSDELVSNSELIGCWKQANRNNELKKSTVCFIDGNKFLVITKDSNGQEENFSGAFYYSNNKLLFLNYFNLGYRNWIRLNIKHDAGPQFYVKKKNGVIQLYRGDYRASITGEAFTKS